MSFFSRFFIFFLAVGVLALSLSEIGIFLGLIPPGIWVNELLFAAGRIETLIAAILCIFIAFNLFGAVFSRADTEDRVRGELLLTSNEMGGVHVSVDAVRHMAEVLACEMCGVIDAKARIRMNRKDASVLGIELKLIVSTKTNVPTLSGELSKRLEKRLNDTLGLTDVPIHITVAGISNKRPSSRQRVV